MFRKSFKSKVIFPAVVILVALTTVLTVYMLTVFLSYSRTLIGERVRINTNSLKFYVENCRRKTGTAAISVADHPKVTQAVKSRDRAEILRVLTPLVELHQVDYFTVTDEKGIVLARTLAPDSFGDLILNQQNIKNAVEGKISTFFETDTLARVAVRTGVPVYDAGGIEIGIIVAGIRLDTNETVDFLKEYLYSEVTVFFGDTRIATTITDKDGQRITGTKMDPDIARGVIEEQKEYFGSANIFGMEYKTFYMPLVGANNKVFAVLFVGTPLSEIKAEAMVLIRNIVLISLLGLVAAIAILYSAISSISEPIMMLSNAIDCVAQGDLSVTVKVKNDDEIGHAGTSLQKAINITCKLIDDINFAISEHEKGNTEYRFDTNAFHGDFRLLADRIMELSSLGMKDQLTGIPNRRSFDARLDLEWHRAMRDKTPLSFLILDVDKFKTYNDTYGHQQGDLALQTVAKTLTVPLKRGFDFVARWGGEEFVVLLPNTDSTGALHVAEMIRREVENREIPCLHGEGTKKVTISIGVNTQIPSLDHSIASLISQADAALYRAKATGRNKVCRYEDDKELTSGVHNIFLPQNSTGVIPLT